MGLVLPVQVAPASSWALYDYRSVRTSSAPAVGGVAQLEVDVDPDELWLLDHAVSACNSSTATSVRLYSGSVSDLALIDGTLSGNFDVADWPNGLQLNGTNLVVRWDGCSDGAIGVLTLQARILRRS